MTDDRQIGTSAIHVMRGRRWLLSFLHVRAGSGTGDVMCAKCGKAVQPLVDVGASTGGDELARSMAEQAFVFRKQAFCCLDCFFEAYLSKPGLCRYVDSLFTMAVKVARIQQGRGGRGSGGNRK